MGHANLSNLSDLWVNLLYAKGRLTIGQAVETAIRRGEELHASEGGYDDEGMLGMGIEEGISFLVCDGRSARANWGWDGKWHGPFIEPILDARAAKPNHYRLSATVDAMLRAVEESPDNAELFKIASDAIRDEGQEEWADFVRDLPAIRESYRLWDENAEEFHEWPDGDGDSHHDRLDRVPFRFCKGKRRGYKEIPRVGNVTH